MKCPVFPHIIFTEVPPRLGERQTEVSEIYNGSKTNFTDELQEKGTFYYAITAENDNGESVVSNCLSFVTISTEKLISIKFCLKPEYIDAFEESLGEFIADLIKNGTEPTIYVIIKAKIPATISKMAQKTLKKKFEDSINNTSAIIIKELDWDLE